MKSQILVENSVGTKGHISSISDIDRQWSHNETLAEWVKEYPSEPLSNYHRNFSLIIVTDKPPQELTYLTEPLIIDGDPISAKWCFVAPDSDSPEWIELFQTGQIEKTWLELQSYIVELT